MLLLLPSLPLPLLQQLLPLLLDAHLSLFPPVARLTTAAAGNPTAATSIDSPTLTAAIA